MPSANHLGDYLRARRERVQPHEVGLPPGGRRRVQGLRREELAMLAGISSDYYVRLEQGRDQHPSAQVLDSLARALGLDAHATAHLHRLAAPAHTPAGGSQRVPPSIVQLIDGWDTTPAYVLDRLVYVVAANAIAGTLSPNYVPGRNLLKAVFLDQATHELQPDWRQTSEDGVAALRALAVENLDDPGLTELVEELSAASPRFRELWQRHDIKPKVGGINRYVHPVAGPLELHSEKLAITGTDGLMLVICHADPGSRSAEALAELARARVQPMDHAAI